jgi:hypothetical protein
MQAGAARIGSAPTARQPAQQKKTGKHQVKASALTEQGERMGARSASQAVPAAPQTTNARALAGALGERHLKQGINKKKIHSPSINHELAKSVAY